MTHEAANPSFNATSCAIRKPTVSCAMAGLLALVGATSPLGIWYAYLFVGTPSGVPLATAAMEQFKFSFSPESAAPWAFAILLALPCICLGIAFVYLTGLAAARRLLLGVFGATAVAAVAAAAISDWPLVLFLSASAYCGWRGHNGT